MTTSPLDLAAIRKRDAEVAQWIGIAEQDRRDLLAEVDGLAAELAAMKSRVEESLAGSLHDRHAVALNGVIGDCAGCAAEGVRAALAGEGVCNCGYGGVHEPENPRCDLNRVAGDA